MAQWLVMLPHSETLLGSIPRSVMGLFHVEFVCSSRVDPGFLRVLWFPFTVHADVFQYGLY